MKPDELKSSTRSGRPKKKSAEEIRFEHGTNPNSRDPKQRQRAEATLELIRFINPRGFTLTPASYLPWDGNCYFAALHFFMCQWGIVENWTVKSLREAVFMYMKQHRDDEDSVFFLAYTHTDAGDDEDLRRNFFAEDCEFLATHSQYFIEKSTIGDMVPLGISLTFNISIKLLCPRNEKNPEQIIGDPHAPRQMVLGYIDIGDSQHVQALVPYP